MAAILLKNVPYRLKERLQREAQRNRRSMNQQILLILERATMPLPPVPPPARIKPLKPFTQAWLRRAIEEGRA